MSQMSGQITVTTAGTAVAGPDAGPGEVLIQPNPGNSGSYVYVGNNGSDDVASDTGFTLAVGEKAVITVKNLNAIYFDADANGDKVDWLLVSGPQRTADYLL
jgi:hypothetical protein